MQTSISPNFFIVGAPKAGTTSLYEYLAQHPDIYMSPLKETNYFAFELRLENFSPEDRPRIDEETRALQEYLQTDLRAKRFGGLVSSWEDYLKLFAGASGKVAVGEATPVYLWSESAARNIAQSIPHARIIISLRNPIERAFSQYLHMVNVGAISRSFREQIEADLRRKHRLIGPDFPFLEYGLYYEQLKRYQRLFPASQIHISLYEELQDSPQALVSRLHEFLGVDRARVPDVSKRHLESQVRRLIPFAALLKRWGAWPYLRGLLPRPLAARLPGLVRRPRAALAMRSEDRKFLIDYYRDDVNNLASLLNRDLTAWLDPNAAVRARAAQHRATIAGSRS
jgi:hypothetical protein